MHGQVSKTKQIEAQTSGLERAFDCFKDGIMLVDTSTPFWNIIFINDSWRRLTGNAACTKFLCDVRYQLAPIVPVSSSLICTYPCVIGSFGLIQQIGSEHYWQEIASV